MSDKEYNDDLTTKYCTIIKINASLSPSKQISTKVNRANDQVSRLKTSDSLDFHVRTLMTNSRNLAKQKNNKPTKAIGDRLGGKNGIMRGRLMGKRVNQSARTVAGPDPTLDVDEVGIPQEIANELTVQQRVCPLNVAYLTELMMKSKINSYSKDGGKKIFNMKDMRRGTDPRNLLILGDLVIRDGKIIDPVRFEYFKEHKFQLVNGDKILRSRKSFNLYHREEANMYEISWRRQYWSHSIVIVKKSPLGDLIISGARIIEPNFPKINFPKLTTDGDCVVSRQLRNGDYILLNRQPTIHEFNIMAHKVRILPEKTIRINLAICSPYNCDFDGGSIIAVNREH